MPDVVACICNPKTPIAKWDGRWKQESTLPSWGRPSPEKITLGLK